MFSRRCVSPIDNSNRHVSTTNRGILVFKSKVDTSGDKIADYKTDVSAIINDAWQPCPADMISGSSSRDPRIKAEKLLSRMTNIKNRINVFHRSNDRLEMIISHVISCILAKTKPQL